MWSRGDAISAMRGLKQLTTHGMLTFTLLAHELHEMPGFVDQE
jgi:hypothetical protein